MYLSARGGQGKDAQDRWANRLERCDQWVETWYRAPLYVRNLG